MTHNHLAVIAVILAGFGAAFTARGESLAAFDGPCIPAGGVAPRSNTRILGLRALPVGHLARLGAAPDFYHGLSGQSPAPLPAAQQKVGQLSVQERLKRVGADLFSQSGSVEAAIAELKAILAVDPQSVDGHFLLGIAYGRQGSRDMLAEAVAEFRQALAINPAYVQARYYLAQVYLDLGRAERAREELASAIGQAGEQVQLLALLGEVERQLGNPARSIELNRKALAANQTFAQARYYLGLALLDLKQRDEGVAEIERAAKGGPPLPEVLVTLGAAYLDAGRIDDAIGALGQAVKMDPSRPNARIRLARAYRMKGQLAQAEAQLKLAAPPGSVATTSPLDQQIEVDLNLERGRVRWRQGQRTAALQAFRKALELDPDHGPTHRELAEAYLLQGSYARALEHATRADTLGSPLPGDQLKALQDKLRKE